MALLKAQSLAGRQWVKRTPFCASEYLCPRRKNRFHENVFPTVGTRWCVFSPSFLFLQLLCSFLQLFLRRRSHGYTQERGSRLAEPIRAVLALTRPAGKRRASPESWQPRPRGLLRGTPGRRACSRRPQDRVVGSVFKTARQEVGRISLHLLPHQRNPAAASASRVGQRRFL